MSEQSPVDTVGPATLHQDAEADADPRAEPRFTPAEQLLLDDQLCFALYAATNAVVRSYRPLLAEIGLTYPQYLVMLVLWQDGDMPVSGIAQRLHLGNNALTPLVDRLEAAELVQRTRSDSDRRRLIVRLTARGRALETAAAQAQARVACATGLTASGLADLRERLHRLIGRMEPTGTGLDEATQG